MTVWFTGTGLRIGCGVTLPVLPMPLGSLIEPLSPRAFAGPGGMPLTPASWAGDLPGDARIEVRQRSAMSAVHKRRSNQVASDSSSVTPAACPSGYQRKQLGRTGRSSLEPTAERIRWCSKCRGRLPFPYSAHRPQHRIKFVESPRGRLNVAEMLLPLRVPENVPEPPDWPPTKNVTGTEI